MKGNPEWYSEVDLCGFQAPVGQCILYNVTLHSTRKINKMSFVKDMTVHETFPIESRPYTMSTVVLEELCPAIELGRDLASNGRY